MKITSIAFLAFAALAQETLAGELDCTDCFEDLDLTRDCLRICNNDYVIDGDSSSGGLLDACIASATDDSYSNDDIEDVDSIADFSDCCRFSGSCRQNLDTSEECFQECLPACIKETPKEWLDCISTEMEEDSENCGRQACLDGFLAEDGLQDELGLSGDILDLRNIEERLNRIEADDLEDCGLLTPFVEEVCDIGDNCCRPCREELASVVDCIINDVVIPFVALELNTTIEECPINVDTCEMSLGNRELSQEQIEKFNAFRQQQAALPQSKRNSKQEAFRAKRALEKDPAGVDECSDKMVQGILLKNATEGGNDMMDCVINHANEALGQEVTDDSEKESGSFIAFSAAGLVAAIAGSVIAFF